MLELVCPSGQALPAFAPGAHIDLHLPGGLVRQYSLCNSPLDRTVYRIGVLLETCSRGGSTAVHALSDGTLVSVSEPRNQFALDSSASHSVLLAGGIGITPLLCMAEHLSATRRSFELHYFVRTRSRAAFLDRLEAPDLKQNVALHSDDQHDDFDVGTALRLATATNAHAYVCGPNGFIEAMLTSAVEAGFTQPQLHREYFTPVATRGDEFKEFCVELARSGRSIRVSANETVVSALANAGVEIPVSCEQGVCGTCITKVLCGMPLHRDTVLTDAEHARNDQFTPCCSRSKSSVLVLDL
ncbi:PDR/VanB family oxidoreductase [Paraburkholderia sediminicola]|uniref:PDR/VanB family oxidoreductase n=1 Tax=Paraburkholderia sediminicola TaxID=458836 RepID=UPI0038BB8DD7